MTARVRNRWPLTSEAARAAPDDYQDPDTWVEATFEWLPASNGRWHLDTLASCYRSPSNPDGTQQFDIDVLEFDGDHGPPPGRFTPESLNIRDGTRVQEWSDPRTMTNTYVVGGSDAELDGLQEALDRYAQQLRSSGFAAPARD